MIRSDLRKWSESLKKNDGCQDAGHVLKDPWRNDWTNLPERNYTVIMYCHSAGMWITGCKRGDSARARAQGRCDLRFRQGAGGTRTCNWPLGSWPDNTCMVYIYTHKNQVYIYICLNSYVYIYTQHSHDIHKTFTCHDVTFT